MSDTYCGKSCTDCSYKEKLACPGCKAGPGKIISGDCALAACCREKECQSCSSCSNKTNCGKLSGCESVPESRWVNKTKDGETTKAKWIGKIIGIMFGLALVKIVSSVLSQDFMLFKSLMLYLGGLILGLVVDIAYGVSLLRLSSINERFRTAGILFFVSPVISIVAAIIARDVSTTCITFAVLIVALIGEYNEYMGYADILYNIDYSVSKEWANLIQRYIGFAIVLIVSTGLSIFSALLMPLIALVSSIGILVVKITKLVYLRNTAEIFKNKHTWNLPNE